jgi:hypothetical protein
VLVEFWVLNTDLSLRCPLPDVETFTISPVVNDAGSLTFTYPANGVNWSVLNETVVDDRDLMIRTFIDGVAQDELLSYVSESAGDDVVEGSVWSYTGLLAAGRLSEAVVEPQGGMPTQGDDATVASNDAHYYSCTAGTIVATLMAEAVARGALTDMTWASFTGTHDSAGVSWTQIITLTFAPGTDYLKCLQGLATAGMCEFKVIGKDLKIYQPPFGVDRTLTNPPVVFREGQSIVDSPRKHTVRGTATSALVAGALGVYQWASDAGALTRRGRRIEIGVSQGQISDPTTLTAYSQFFLSGAISGTMEKTHGLTLDAGSVTGGPVPLRDFDTGDWGWSDLGSDLERLRVAQWTIAQDADGELSGSVVLNDLIAERTAALALRLQGIAGGTTITGTSNARPIPTTLIDGIAPAPPTGVTVSSIAYTTDQNVTLAAVSVQWDPVGFNSDGTAVTDLGLYAVYWKYTDVSMSPVSALLSWMLVTQTQDTFANFSAVRPGAAIQVRVGVSDTIGNFSGWSSTVNHTTASDTTAPPTPSTPVVTALLAALRVEWNGLGSLGEAMPKDFRYVEVHVSTVSSFTPTSTTLWDTIGSAAALGYTKGTYGTTYFVRLVGVDMSGNRSATSAQASGVPRQILNPDYAALSIGSAAINDLDVGKITAGTLSAAVILSGSIATAASGARFGMNSSELFAFNSSAVKTFQVTNAGAVSILGEIKTGITGARIVINPSGTAPTEIRFYPANNTLGKFISLFTADVPGYAGYSLTYLKGDRQAGLSGEAVLRMWWYEAAFGWFDSTAGLLVDTESAVYARQYSAGMNSSRLLFIAHGLRDVPYHEFAFTTSSATIDVGLGRMKKDSGDAFIIGCPAKGSAFAFQVNWIYAVAEGNTSLHVGFTADTVTQSSGVAKKTNIKDISVDVLDVLERAPSRQWEYIADHLPRGEPDPVRLRRSDPGPGEHPDVLVPVRLESSPLVGVRHHFGPMAEDLPVGVRVYTPRDPTEPHIDHGSMMGFMWEILRKLHGRLKKQGSDIEAIKAKVGL